MLSKETPVEKKNAQDPVGGTVKTVLPYRNDTMIAFEVLAINLRIPGLIGRGTA